MRQTFGQYFNQHFGILVAAARRLRGFRLSILNGLDIRQHQLELDSLDVRQWIDVSANVNHVLVFEATHHLHDRVDLANVAQEFIT